jgi:hypothetical protein
MNLTNLHLHNARKVMAWVIGIAAFSPFLLYLDDPAVKNRKPLSEVTGRVTYSGHPLSEVTICLDRGGDHAAFSSLSSDGSFRLRSMELNSTGAYRGRYHAHLYSNPNGPSLPAKFADPKTSGVEIEIDADWNDLNIDLN